MLQPCSTATAPSATMHARRLPRRWTLGSLALAAAWLLATVLPSPAEAATSLRERRAAPTTSSATARTLGGLRRVVQLRRTHEARRAPARLRASELRRVPAGLRAAPPSQNLDTVRLALEEAARATEMDRDVLQRIAERESRLNPAARSRSSSATGLMQFTRDTWLEAVRDFGPRHGLASEAALLDTNREGTIEARDPRTQRRILLLRENARYSAVLAAERLRAARPGLERMLGREATPSDLYLVHLLGNTGARRFLAALRDTPQRSSFAVLGEPARANPGVFERNGESLPVARAYAELRRMFEAPLQLATSN